MKRLFLAIGLIGVFGAAIALLAPEGNAAACKWRNIAVGCNGDCVEIYFQDPGTNCPGSTVDVQQRGCGGGSWTTIATNVTSPVLVNCANPGTSADYRLVVNCSCGGTLASPAIGCTTCP